MRGLFALGILLLSMGWAFAEGEDIQIGLSSDLVSITSNFDGENVVVFGSIDNGNPDDLTNARYDIVVVVVGPDQDIVVRKKEWRYGVWVNGKSLPYTQVPSFYSMASNRKLDEIAAPELLSQSKLGFSNLILASTGEADSVDEAKAFRASLNRLMEDKDLSLQRQSGVTFISPTLFRARLAVPANVPIGRHTARAYLFKNGELLTKKSARLAVRKIGFEQYTYDLAHKHGLLYGILAVLIAIATGWLASVVFRKD